MTGNLLIFALLAISLSAVDLDDMLGGLNELPDLIDDSAEERPERPNLKVPKAGLLSMQVLINVKSFEIVCSVEKGQISLPISVACPLARDGTPRSRCFEECLSICQTKNCKDNPLLNQVKCRSEKKGDTNQIIWSGSTQMMKASGRWTCSHAGTENYIDLDLSAYQTTTTTTTKGPEVSTTYAPPKRSPKIDKTFLDPKYNLIDPSKVHSNNSKRPQQAEGFFTKIFKELHLTKPVLVIALLTLLLVSIVVNVAFCIRCLLMRRYLHLRGRNISYPNRGLVNDLDLKTQKAKNPSILSYVFCCYCCHEGNEMANGEVNSQILINDPTYDMNHQHRFDSEQDLKCLERCLCLPSNSDEKSPANLHLLQSNYVRTSQPVLYQERQAFPSTIYGSTHKLYPYLQTTTNQGHPLYTINNHYRSNSSNELMYEEMVPATLARIQPVETGKMRSLMNTPLQGHYNHWPMFIPNNNNASNQNNGDLTNRIMSRSFTSQQFQSVPSDCTAVNTANHVLVKNFEPTIQNPTFSRFNSLPRSPTVPVNAARRLNKQCSPGEKNRSQIGHSYVYAIPKKHDFPQVKYLPSSATMIGGSEDSGVQLHLSSSTEKLHRSTNPNNYDQSPLTSSESNNSSSPNPTITVHETTTAATTIKTDGEKCVRLEMTKNLMKKADILLREADGLLNE